MGDESGGKKKNEKRGIGRRKAAASTKRAITTAASAAASSSAAAATLRTDAPGLLFPTTPLERTHKLRQPALRDAVDATTAAKASFSLNLASSNLGPYVRGVYSRSGRSMLVASRRGHVAAMDWRSAKMHAEITLNETVRDAVWLHNETYFALAQKKYVHIYDASGTQIHVMRKHRTPGCLAFLPHHFLLASASAAVADDQRITYTDTSTGVVVADLAFGARALNLGPVAGLAVNGSSGVLNAAHGNGVVSLWSPMQSVPLARFFAHPGGVRHIAVTLDGRTIVTTGADATVRAWDSRMFQARAAWALPATPTALAVSQRGLVAAGFGATVHVWSSAEETKGRRTTRREKIAESAAADAAGSHIRPPSRGPYMVQQYPGTPVTGLDFCPFEDVLAVCHVGGMASMIVPGAGEAVFDMNAPNPYETAKSRREAEVRDLLDKLKPETIALDVNTIGGVDADPAARLTEMRAQVDAGSKVKRDKMVAKRRGKGKGKISKQLARKQKNVVDSRRVDLTERRDKERAEKLQKEKRRNGEEMPEHGDDGEVVQPALRRFYTKQK